MAAVSSSAGYQAATQAAFQQLKVQQARQNADRAEQVANALAAKANEAQRDADRAEENARSLSVQSNQARTAAGQARQGLSMVQSVSRMAVQLAGTVEQVVERTGRQASSSEAPPAKSAPVMNTTGQMTGTVVNTTA